MSSVAKIREAREGRELQHALRLAEEYVAAMPDDAEGWMELGKVTIRLGLAERAADAAKRALEKKDADPDLLFQLGRWSAQAGDFEQALAAFRELEAVADRNAWEYLADAVLLFRAFTLMQLRRWDEAASDADRTNDEGDVYFCGQLINRSRILEAVRNRTNS